jgi:UDP-N-acetylmuramoyl-L-alanyl-D-glutamate--2,6-diaminopimelate ligase
MHGALAYAYATPKGDPKILGLTSDSRDVKPGYLFAALAGTHDDGARFLGDALAKGAAAVLAREAPAGASVPVIVDANPRRALALMAARFYAPQPAMIAAITGTNGKTSVAVFARQLWQGQGFQAASMGTIGIVAPGIDQPGSLTTPDPVKLHQEVQKLARADIGHLALEASSHGLDQHRLDGLQLAAAAFTNLSRDHLDYHRDIAAYLAAKTRLFTELLPANGTAIINIDEPEGQRLAALCRKRGQRVIGFGRSAKADLRLASAQPHGAGLDVEIAALGERRKLQLPLLGSFQAMNVLAALGVVLATGAELGAALDALPTLAGVPGRMELVATSAAGAPVIVDYAHTPDALETALRALRPHCTGRLVLVFGCGGDRDRGKRPLMGAIAEELADIVIVTDDNPRSENPAAIRHEILAACPKAREIGDRGGAIGAAIDLLRAGDLLLIAGKGHERDQIVGTRTLPFSDKDFAQAAIAGKGRA